MSFKMPFKTPALAMVAFCSLVSACGEEHKSTHPMALATKPAQAEAGGAAREQDKLVLPKSAQTGLDLPLTATAPAMPRSILDSTQPAGSTEETKPAPMPEKQAKPASASPEQVKLDRFVLATDVAQREPVGESERFTTETPKIFAFMQFANQQAPFAVKVYWEKVGDPASPYGVELMVPTAARYRTWSWTKIRREPGTYRAVVRTLEGQELASKEFTIEVPAHQASAE